MATVFCLFVFNQLGVLECGLCRRKGWGCPRTEKAVGEGGERPARRIMEGSKVIPRGGESMESQGKPGSHSSGNDVSSEQ